MTENGNVRYNLTVEFQFSYNSGTTKVIDDNKKKVLFSLVSIKISVVSTH